MAAQPTPQDVRTDDEDNSNEQFVILQHTVAPGTLGQSGRESVRDHWDLMLQLGDALLCWQLAISPFDQGPIPPGPKISSRRIANHRLAYLDYEGPISNNRGSVRRWDRGNLTWIERPQHDATAGAENELMSGNFRVQLKGARIVSAVLRFTHLVESEWSIELL